MSIGTRCVTALLLLSAVCANAAQLQQTGGSTTIVTSPPGQTMSMSEVIAQLQQQQKDLAQQQQLLEAQSQEIAGLKQELNALRVPIPVATEPVIASTQTPAAVLATEAPGKAVKAAQAQTRDQQDTETRQAVARAQADDPSSDLLGDLPGGWRLPGTNAELRIGGYVKTDIIYNFDPLQIQDRFIVGSIPVGDTNSDDTVAQTSITASQSRLNFDLREPTKLGQMRAFIEGDFAGDNDTFRLRHAFGQWDRVLAGKTWTAFMDAQASPEELDFEGLNSRINVRQAQVRFMPRLGNNYEFQFSLEDPNPEVQDGQGVSRIPDVVASARFKPDERLHLKLALIGREIRAQRDSSVGTGVEKKFGGGVSFSGSFSTPLLDERDGLMFQLNAGNGIGRYVNDLKSIGSFDGIFNPANGELKQFDIVAGYVSWQHWWLGSSSWRSNFTFGVVEVDNPDFVEGDAYKRTLRYSNNIFWSPTKHVELGAEYLWGRRENEDGKSGDATQIQLGVRYLF